MKCLFLVLILSIFNITAQTVRINEITSSNSIYLDEDGDAPDWIELHNDGTDEVSISGWYLSDDVDNLSKWTFPDITLVPNQYLLLWASSKDRSSISYSRTLVNQGDTFKYLIPTSEPSSNWKSLGFNDVSWLEGSSGFGYNDGDDATIIPNGTQSIYLRKTFTVTDVNTIASLILDMDYDDGFVAYINGSEIARANINGVPPNYNSGTIQDHEAQMYAGGAPERFMINNFNSILNTGENILTIQAHNISSNSSDFTIIPFLSAVFSTPTSSGIAPPAILGLTTNNLHTNFKISSNSETVSLTNATGTIVDQIITENLPPNTSIGVSIDSGTIVSYSDTTPGLENSNNEFLGAIQNKVVFSHDGGLIDNSINLTLSGVGAGEVIRYTTGGSVPTEASPMYTNPIQINDNISVRARIFSTNYLPSRIFTKSYILNANHEIDVFFLTTEPDNFFDEDAGIYVFGPPGTYETNEPYFGANFWEDWERPIHIAFYENEDNTFAEFDGGIKIFGGWSRGQNKQRSLSLFARGQYGDSKFDHPFFDELNYDNFQALILRNSGQDWMKSSMKDITLTSLMRGSGLDFQEHNSVATYINGEYWGMYNMREKINEHMLASKHNIDADAITLLTNNAEEIRGSNAEYIQLINYINTTDLSLDSNFEYVNERVDLKEYALYQAANIFFSNTDWPGNNIKFWKHPEGKWRWIMYDTDFGFGPFWNTNNYTEDTLSFALEPNGSAWPNPAWSTLLFRKLITNIGFRNRFINRYADELNTRFLTNSVKAHIDEIHQIITPEINASYQRWGTDPSEADNFMNVMKVFADNRPAIVKEHIKSKFNLPDYYPITITNTSISEGLVEVNENLKIQEPSWTGDYFETVSIQLTAIPEAGFEFSHWSGAISSTNETINISLVGSLELTPNFSPSTAEFPLVINEINYRSSDDFKADDWVELYNPNTFSIDLINWQLKDNNDANVYTIPTGTTIEADGYLVLVKDAADFSSVYPEITSYVGDIGFGFGSPDAVRLFNADQILQDEVTYNSTWADCANATGKTLELIASDLDNSLPESWDCSNTNGSPNTINDASLSVDEVLINNLKVYPNPAQNILYITGTVSQFKVHIYTVTGQEIFNYTNTNQLDVSLLKQGMYFIKISENKKSTTFNFVKY